MFENRLKDLTPKTREKPEVRAEAGEVFVYDAIGGLWGVSPKDFADAVRSIKGKVVHLRINSPGGDVFDARAMVAAVRELRASGKRVVSHIDGLAASAASYLALAADEVEMHDGAFFMIHNAWGMTIGNAEEHTEAASLLSKVDASIRKDYAAKTGKDEAELSELMAAETWYSAQEALEAGFIDRVVGEKHDDEEEEDEDEDEEKSTKDAFTRLLRAFKNAPDGLRIRPRKIAASVPDAAAGSASAEIDKAEVALIESNKIRLDMFDLVARMDEVGQQDESGH